MTTAKVAKKKATPKKPKPSVLLAADALKFSTATMRAFDKLKKEPAAVAAFYIGLRDALDSFQNSMDGAQTLLGRLKGEIIPQLFEDNKVSTVTIGEDGAKFRVTVSELLRVSVGEDKDKAKQWLRDNGLSELIIETVNAGTLASAAKAMAEEGKELDPDLFKSAIMKTTSVTKVK